MKNTTINSSRNHLIETYHDPSPKIIDQVRESYDTLVSNAMEKGSDLEDAHDEAILCLEDMYGKDDLDRCNRHLKLWKYQGA